jgi:nitrite reductase/ring-hydroxylating ferredoxin subunit
VTGRTIRLDAELLPERGRVRVVDAGGRRVGLLWIGEELHALADSCPHRGAPLCSAGQLVPRLDYGDGGPERRDDATMIRCPWHRWEFDVRTGACPEAPSMRVRRYRVWREDGDIVVNLGPMR